MLTIQKPKTIDEVVDKFVIKTLPKISGESLNKTIQALNSNTTDIPTAMAFLKRVQVRLIMKDTIYATLVTGTPYKYPKNPSARPTITTNTTVSHCQQTKDTYGKSRRMFENSATMDKSLQHQITETIKDNYIEELHNKYTVLMGVNVFDMVRHLMDIQGKFIEKNMKENQKIFDGALDTTILIGV